jgi:hypothetical protein
VGGADEDVDAVGLEQLARRLPTADRADVLVDDPQGRPSGGSSLMISIGKSTCAAKLGPTSEKSPVK